MKIAVIGSGVAGLTAAWLLQKDHQVTIYERQGALGMDAHSMDVDVDGVRVRLDVPIRFSFPTYYKHLYGLYQHLDVPTVSTGASGAFVTAQGTPYFYFGHGGLVPRLKVKRVADWRGGDIVRDGLRFYLTAPRDLDGGRVREGETILAYLERKGYSDTFIHGFLLPVFATIGTCSYAAIQAYPAQVILDTIKWKTLWQGFQILNRTRNGTRELVQKMAADFDDVRLNTSVQAVCRTPDGVTIQTEAHGTESFDHVILATQANHVLKLLTDATEAEAAMIGAFGYEDCEVSLHRDPHLAPLDPANWGMVNFMMGHTDDKPYVTGWLNPMYAELAGRSPIFHTLNPQIGPADELARIPFQRAIVNAESMRGLADLERLHADPERRVWFCGAYAAYGIPLQETGVASAVDVARRLGVSVPFRA